MGDEPKDEYTARVHARWLARPAITTPKQRSLPVRERISRDPDDPDFSARYVRHPRGGGRPKQMGGEELMQKTLHLRMPERDWNFLDTIRKQQNLSMNAFIIRAIQDALESKGGK